MAHQFPNQLLDRGENGKRVYNSIMENASTKVVFRLSHEENLRAMAQWLFMGVMNSDEIKHQLYSTKVMSYREEMREIVSEGSSSGRGGGHQRGAAGGQGMGGTAEFFDGEETLRTSESWSEFASGSESESESWSETASSSRSLVHTLIPEFGKELSHVQFRTLEEQLFRAMAVLFDQKERQAVARVVGMSAPVSIYTPTVEKPPATKDRVKRYLDRTYKKLPFALKGNVAHQEVADREKSFAERVIEDANQEPTTAARRIK
jgi:hypothetical protein